MDGSHPCSALQVLSYRLQMLVDVLGYVDGPESIMDSYSSILEDRDTRQPANPALAPKIAWAMGALASCESSAETVLNQGESTACSSATILR